MNAIDAAFERLKTGNKKAFIPFIAAGDPDIESTKELAKTLAKNGASIIEIGFPITDFFILYYINSYSFQVKTKKDRLFVNHYHSSII